MFVQSEIRSQFPVLNQVLAKGVPVTYLDTGASAQKPQTVIDAERRVYETHYANAYRGVYRFGAEIDEELEATRESVRQLINADRVEEIAFTSGTTASLNVIATGWGRTQLQPGDEILLSIMEHHANFVPWQQIAIATGAVLKFLPLTESGELDLSQLDQYLTTKTRIVAVTAMSNVLGTINPIAFLARKAHEVGAIIVVDAAQSVPHIPIDVQAEQIDFLAFSGHKLYGPTGVGVLYGRHELLEQTEPLLFGGHMIERVSTEKSAWSVPPAKFEAGTIPIVQAIGLKAAIDFVQSVGFDNIAKHEHALTEYAWDKLKSLPGVKIYGPELSKRGAILSFTMEKAHPEDLAQLLDRKGVFVRHGHHCTMPLHHELNVPSTVRASFGVYNNFEDVDRFYDALVFARQRLRIS